MVLGGVFVAHLGRAREPLIPPSIFANRVVDKAAASMFFGMLVYVAAIVYVPLYFETGFGLDPTASGFGLIVVLGASVLGSNFTGLRLPRLRRYKMLGNVGLPIAALALAALAALAPRLDFWGAESLILIYGLGLGTLFPTLTVSVQNAADPRDMGAATATLAFVRNLGSAIGVAVFGAVLFGYGLAEPGVGVRADPILAARAFRAAFALMAVATAISFLFFLAMEERPLRGPRAGRAGAQPALGEMLPAIGAERGARDEARVVGDEEHHRARDLFGLAEPADRDQRQDVLGQHLAGIALTISVPM